MKQYQKLAMISLITLFMSTNAHAWGAKRPSTPSTPTIPPPTTPTAPTTPTTPTAPTLESSYINQIKSIAANSACANYSWKNRGKAPAAYIKGMALNYARSLCRLQTTLAAPTATAVLLGSKAGDAAKDALAYYSSTFSSLGFVVNSAGQDSLRSLYTLGIGLGMRESSGQYCEGRDTTASNTSASTAEAGMFQTSYNSMTTSPVLGALYAEYKVRPELCMLDVYKVGVSCSATSIYGTGEGATYQSLNKSCPAFAAEYAMATLRVLRSHYGPIVRKEAEVLPACNAMLKNVQDLINNDLNACDDLL
ncbi:MAG: hypothetical protein H7336_02280 [Bacteriovorax sp.]|nr:hypothetical protein [Bacteriovorax sp.]